MAKLPAYEAWTRPWADGEFDEDRAAKLIYNALRKAEQADDKLATKLSEKDDEIARLNSEVDDVKASKSGSDEETKEELKALRTQVRELTAKAGESRPEDQKTISQLKVALELGLPPKDAARLQGDSYEDILEDGKVFAQDHGIELPGSEDDEDGGQENPATPPSQRPVQNLKTHLKGKQADYKQQADPKKVDDAFSQVPLVR